MREEIGNEEPASQVKNQNELAYMKGFVKGSSPNKGQIMK
jgi:hypothetical protein